MSVRGQTRKEFWDAMTSLTSEAGTAISVEDIHRALGITDKERAWVEGVLEDGIANRRYDDTSAHEFASDLSRSWFGKIMSEIYKEQEYPTTASRMAALRELQSDQTRDDQVLDEMDRERMIAVGRKHITLLGRYRALNPED